jgi:sugar (pentulose or hexulose) kinase
MPLPVIVIFDIGKTNKKVFLFDEDYNIVFEKTEVLLEIKDEDGFPCENVQTLITWIKNCIDNVSGLNEFKIKAINFSAHGASFVHLDENGLVVAPLYNYLKPFPDQLKEKFDDDYNLNEVSIQTASPYLSNLNSGLQLYWLKHERPELFEKIKHSLHLPEFLSYLLTKQKVSGLPSIGCHTMLWNFKSQDYHTWVKKENIISKLAPVVSSDHTVEIQFKGENIHVGIGMHDSSAALIPYLKKIEKPFALISTGTWSISLNPFNHSELTSDELNKDCLCYLRYDGKAVKASRLLIGPEHDEQVKRIAEHFNLHPDFYKSIQFETNMMLPARNELNFSLDEFDSAQQAYHVLMQHLVRIQKASTQLILNNSDVKEIYVDGGFGGNSVYMNLLAREFDGYKVFGSSISQASALGAALAIHSKWSSRVNSGSIQIVSY